MHDLQNSAHARDAVTAQMWAQAALREGAKIKGHFTAVCRDRHGKILWEDEFDNLITTVGVNLMLDSFLAGSAYTVVGPFMGLISSTSFTAVANADTMASHAGWLESGGANAPTMSSARQTCAWSAASARAKTLSANLSFTFTGSGTVQGAFLVTGSGAVSTVGSTAGTLFSAGTLTTPQPVIATNVVGFGWTGTLT